MALLVGTDANEDQRKVRTDSNGYLILTSTSVVGSKVADDAASGGPYYLLSDTDGRALVSVDRVAGTATNVNGGNRDAGTQTVTLADDDPAVASLAIVDAWDGTHAAAVGNNGAQVMGSARSSAETAVVQGESARLVCNLNGELVLAGYDWTSNLLNVAEQDPISEHYVGVTLADVTDYDDAGPSTINYYTDMDGYTRWALQYDLDNGSGTVDLKIYATWQDDGTAPASCAYIDQTNALTGAAVINGTSTGVAIDNAGLLESAKYIKFEIESNTDPNDDGDWTLYLRKLYR